MKFIKTTISAFLLFVLVFTLCSCGSTGKKATQNKRLSIVATIFPYYDFAKQVSGDLADVEMLIKPGADVHSFEPTADDIKLIQDSDIFIYNGGESDEWVDTILDSLDKNNSPKVLKMMDCVTAVPEQDADHNIGDESDEHIWTDPVNAENLVGIISSEMQKLDTTHSAKFKDLSDKYIMEIQGVHDYINSIVNSSTKKSIVVADRFPLLYFTTRYNLTWECAFPGCSTETEPSLSRISKLTDFIKENNISTIFKLDMSDNKVADTLSEETGAKVQTIYSCETISKDMFEKNYKYTTLLLQNAEAIKEALS